MLRPLLGAIALVLLGACSYGSAVDIAPMSARPTRPALPPGDYCEVQGRQRPFMVVSSSDCVPVGWDAPTRTFRLVDAGDGDAGEADEEIVAAITPVGSGVVAAQVSEPNSEAPFQISLFIARGEAFAAVPTLDSDDLRDLARKYPAVTFKEGADGRPYIAKGEVKAVKAFLLAAARQSLRQMHEDGEDLSPGVRDKAGSPDHTASVSQSRDIEAVMKAADRLAK